VRIYRVKNKCMAKPTAGEPTPQCKRKILSEHRLPEAWFPHCGLVTIKENA
jgi:hypothetical protein